VYATAASLPHSFVAHARARALQEARTWEELYLVFDERDFVTGGLVSQAHFLFPCIPLLVSPELSPRPQLLRPVLAPYDSRLCALGRTWQDDDGQVRSVGVHAGSSVSRRAWVSTPLRHSWAVWSHSLSLPSLCGVLSLVSVSVCVLWSLSLSVFPRLCRCSRIRAALQGRADTSLPAPPPPPPTISILTPQGQPNAGRLYVLCL